MTTIYHGTPMTPRAALLDVCKGRAICVSFFRPDDVEAVEAISPAIMFRQRGVLVLESGAQARRGMAREMGLAQLLRVAGASLVPSRTVGGDTRYAGGTVPAQRCASAGMAVWSKGGTPLAHGRPNRAAASALRAIRQGLFGLDWRGKVNRLPSLSRADARGRSGARQPLACHSHDARDSRCIRLPLSQRGQHIAGAERMAL